MGSLEFAGGVDLNPPPARLDGAAWQGDVAGIQDAAQIGGLQTVGRQPFLRIIKVDGSRQDALRSTLEASGAPSSARPMRSVKSSSSA